MKIYIIRHGQTTSDVEDRYGGDYDDHLTELGIKQAKEMAESISNFEIEVIFASPKIRAQETAKILKDATGLEIITVNDLRERNQNGILSGMKRSEALEKYPDLVEKLKDRFNTIEGAEDYEIFRKRIVMAMDSITNSGYQSAAVITHGGPIRRIFGELLGKEAKWEIADCGWLELEYKDGKYELLRTEGITSG